MDYINRIESIIEKSIELKISTLKNRNVLDCLNTAVNAIKNAIDNGAKLLIAGNGGSAADSQHMAAEFVSKFYFDRVALPAIALTTDTSILTSISNDYEYQKIFSRQIEALGHSGDIFLAITTSGNSINLIEAAKTCKKKNIVVIGLTGNNGGKLKEHCDISIDIDDKDTPRIQETHLLFEHIICELIESHFK